jgi:hypothetical protein
MRIVMRKTKKGFFKPKNPQKYAGDVSNIVYRSSWELKFLYYLDNHPDIISYGSEEFAIPYFSPVDRKMHRYFPDFIIKKREKNGNITVCVIEIKPFSQVQAPVKNNKINRTYINETITYAINQAKWSSAKSFCKTKNWEFVILTEKELNIKW